MRAVTRIILLPIILASTSTLVLASGAPVLPEKMAHDTNDLQRAAWACESGAATFMQQPDTAGRARLFLGTVDASANVNDKPALTLQGNRLSGFGKMSDDRGWSNIRFECSLSQDLRQATAFKADLLSSIPQGKGPPPQSGVIKAADSDRMSWRVEAPGPVGLVHGVPETDDDDFRASCLKGMGEIHVDLTNTVKGLKPSGYVTVNITSGSGSGLYIAHGAMDDEAGVALPAFSASTKDPLWHWMATGKSLLVNIGSDYVYEVSLKGSTQSVKALIAACSTVKMSAPSAALLAKSPKQP